jgi:DNA-binding transcriptional MocR family regulator
MQNGRYELHLRRLRKALHTQCLRYVQGITSFFPEDTKISRPQGGYVLWIELNKKVDTMELYQKAMKYNISISPDRFFLHHRVLKIASGSALEDLMIRRLKKV